MMRNWTLKNIPDAKETAIITGANNGLGFELANQLAAKGFHVIMTCRKKESGEQARAKILEKYRDAKISVELLDLAELASVRDFVERINKQHKDRGISLLVNNAGIYDVPSSKTKDGNEIMFQTNHLGPFLLTALLFPLLELSKSARVVTVSSYAASKGKFAADNLRLEEQSYANSKLANLMFTAELHRRLQRAGSHVVSVAAHPGYASTNIFSHSSSLFRSFFYSVGTKLVAQSAEKGIIPIAYACVGTDVSSGEYYGPDGMFLGLSGDHPALVAVPKQAHDEMLCAALWEASEKLIGTAFSMQGKEQLVQASQFQFSPP